MIQVYGWKILYYRINALYSPMFPTKWPYDGYLVADRFSYDYKPGDALRGSPGIHAAGSDNLEELLDYVRGFDAILTIVQFAGTTYVAKNDEGKTIILGEKAKPTAIIVSNDDMGVKIADKYNIPYTTFDDLIEVKTSKHQMDLNKRYMMEYNHLAIAYKDHSWFFNVVPSLQLPSIINLHRISLRATSDYHDLEMRIFDKHYESEVAKITLYPDFSTLGIGIYDNSLEVSQAVGKALLYNAQRNGASISTIAPGVAPIDITSIWQDTSVISPILIEEDTPNMTKLFYLNSDFSLALQIDIVYGEVYSHVEYTRPDPEDLEIISDHIEKLDLTYSTSFADYTTDHIYDYVEPVYVNTYEDLFNDEIVTTRWDMEYDEPIDTEIVYEENIYNMQIPEKVIYYYPAPNKLEFTPDDFLNILSEALDKYRRGDIDENDVIKAVEKMVDFTTDSYHIDEWDPFDWHKFVETIENTFQPDIKPFMPHIKHMMGIKG